MSLNRIDLPKDIIALLDKGVVIPAHPLALNSRREFDQKRQAALTRYYIDAGAGGLAVGVHTTQFSIRNVGLYEPVLRHAMQECLAWSNRPIVMIAGVCGLTQQAKSEAQIAVSLGYHAGLLSLGAFPNASEDELINHCEAISNEIPLFGFYLQTAVGGPTLSSNFWRRFAKIKNVLAIKVAAFNRYRTLDVIRGLVEARAEDDIFLYTGNDDHIVLDLALPFIAMRDGQEITVRFRGGLLGHWSVWTSGATKTFDLIKSELAIKHGSLSAKLLSLDARITDCNSAFFDVANNYNGCIAGCHEVLRRQGLLEGIWCLDPSEKLSPGQTEEIDRVCREHSDLGDDQFVVRNIDRWLS